MPGLAYSSVRSLSRGLAGTSSGVPSRALLRQLMFRHTSPTLSGVIADETPGRGTDRPELIGRCVNFDGTNDTAVATIPAIGLSDFTVSFRFKKAAPGAVSHLIAADGGGGTNSFDVYFDATGKVVYRVARPGAHGSDPSVTADGIWHHCVLSADRDGLANLYIDGQLVNSASIADTAGNSLSLTTLYIGNRRPANNSPLGGSLWDVQLFGTALTASEVNQLYTLCEFALPNTPRLAWYNCESQHPTLLLDSAGNNRHATCSSHIATVGNFFYEGNDVPGSYLNKVGYSRHLHTTGTDNGRIFPAAGIVASNTSGSISLFASIDAFNVSTLNSVFSFSSTGTTGLGLWMNWLGVARFNYGDGVGIGSQPFTATPGRMYHCGITWAGTTVKFYVDGVLIGTKTNAVLNLTGATKYLFGDSTTGRNHSGFVRDFRSYSVTLSDADMAALAANQAIVTQPIYHLPLNEKTGKQFTETVSGSAVTTIGNSGENVWRSVPRNDSDKTKDILKAPLQYIGEAPRHAKLENNNCGTFDGTDDAVGISDPFVGSSQITVTARTRALNTASGGLIGNFLLSTDVGVVLFKTSGVTSYFSLIVRNSLGTTVTLTSTTAAMISSVTTGWHDVVGTWDGATVKLYIDGVLEASGTLVGGVIATPTSGTAIGAYRPGNSSYPGSICDVRVHNVAWTASQVTEFTANGGMELPCTAWYPFSEGKGTTVHNVVPGGAHGAASGIDETLFWGTKQPVFAFNSAMGSSRRTNYLSNTSDPTVGVGGLTLNAVTLTNVADPWGTTKAFRLLPTNTNNETHRMYITGNSAASGKFLVAYVKQVGSGTHFGWLFSSGSNGYYTFSLDSAEPGSTLVHISDAENGWKKIVWSITAVGSNVLQCAATLTPSLTYAPASTSDGVDFVVGVVDDWQTQDIRPTSGTPIISDRVPAIADGSGKDITGFPIMYAPSPGVWPLSEATLNSNPNNAPRRDWSLPVNLCLTSENFTSGEWGKTRGSVSVVSGQNAFGGSVEFSFTEDSTTGAHYVGDYINFETGRHTAAAIVKANGRNYCAVQCGNGTNWGYIYFDLATGAKLSSVVGAGSPNLTGSISPAGNGYYLVTVSADLITATGGFAVAIYSSVDGLSISHAGSNSNALLLSGGMFARGEHTAYMPFNYNPNDPSDFTPNPPELVQFNSEFSNAYWVNYRLGVTSNAVADPISGALIADKLTPDTTPNSTHALDTTLGTPFLPTAGVKYVQSWVLKAAGYNYVAVLTVNPSQSRYFDIVNGTVLGTYSAMPDDAWVDNLGDGWFRVNIVVTTTLSAGVKAALYLSETGSSLLFTGNGTSGIYACRASLKRYFPTNPNNFHRRRTSGGQLVGIDRVVQYKQPLLGTRLTQVQTFTTEKAL